MESGSEEPAGGREAFRLGPYEAQIWGLHYDGDRLRVGPSGGALVSRLCYGLFAALFGCVMILGGLNPENFTVNGWPVENGEPYIVLGVAVVAAMWADAWRRLRQRIIATPAGLLIRHGFFGSSRLSWDEVNNIAVGHHKDSRWDWGVTIIGAGASPRLVTDYDWPIIESRSGRRINVDGLATMGVTEGWSDGLPSGAQQRMEVLRRFAAQYRPAIQSPLRVASDRPWIPHWVRRVGVFAGSMILLVVNSV